MHPKVSALIGSILIASAFCLIGPVSILPITPWVPCSTLLITHENYNIFYKLIRLNCSTLGLIITGLVMHGFGIAAVLVASFADALRTAM